MRPSGTALWTVSSVANRWSSGAIPGASSGGRRASRGVSSSCFAIGAPPRGSYPFTPPAVSPPTRYFWSAKKSTTTGMETMIAPAAKCPHSVE